MCCYTVEAAITRNKPTESVRSFWQCKTRAFILKGASGFHAAQCAALDASSRLRPPPLQHANYGATPIHRRLVNYTERAARRTSRTRSHLYFFLSGLY